MNMRTSIEIDATPERVFYWLDDPKRIMEWVPQIIENENLEETPQCPYGIVHRARGIALSLDTVYLFKNRYYFLLKIPLYSFFFLVNSSLVMGII